MGYQVGTRWDGQGKRYGEGGGRDREEGRRESVLEEGQGRANEKYRVSGCVRGEGEASKPCSPRPAAAADTAAGKAGGVCGDRFRPASLLLAKERKPKSLSLLLPSHERR